jgi:4-coumarate--CoA ligase (photoactive yellow protein activation family)
LAFCKKDLMQLHLTREDVEVLVSSIISYELSKQHNSYFPLHFEFAGRGDFSVAPFECDSLSLVTLAVAVGEYFGVNKSGLEENFIRYRDFVSWVDIVCDSLEYYSEGITFFTSGTTGEPKKVFHTMQNLQREAEYLAKILEGAKRITSFLRPHHIYGFLYTIALPKFLGVQRTFHEPIPNSTFFQTPNESLLISTPTLYDMVIKKEQKFAANITAISSTEPLKRKTKEGLQKCGIERVVEIYGSSQSLGVGYRYDNDEYFKLFSYLEKESLCDIQDRLEWKNEREFVLGERLDEAIKQNGYLVDLKEYEVKINKLAGIQKCDLLWSKGELIAFIETSDKTQAMQSIAQIQEKKPDSIVWVNQ